MKYLLLFLLIIPLAVFAQRDSSRLEAGIEQDVLPYITGGYFIGGWVGKEQLRARFITAKVNRPGFIVKDGFANNKVTAYALLADYFLKKGWKGWWIGSGLVYWDNSIQSDQKLSTAHYNNVLLNGSIGYNWKFAKRFYLSPWAGMHIRIGGAKTVMVDGKTFTPPLLNPEGSLKIGYRF